MELQVLDISSTAVTDVGPLADLPKLRNLNIRNTPIRDLSAILDKPGLEIIQ